ncbi:MAG: serine hydrolase [Bacteroidota bacterium]|nr:serine hydrolase [Bacteroidota bacterium]MDP4232760.1 serine hydrolase [Bacteroidota bacterium]MDP4242558.1 serine hydrolase [Bacteroidota bacterium]MDP4289375.1 serine hydrolase [Bacteroidota bacterium]
MTRRLGSLIVLLCIVPLPSFSQARRVRYTWLDRTAPIEIPSVAAIIVERSDTIEFEKYFHGARADSALHVMSVTKSFVSAIAGAAYDRALFRNFDTLVLSVLPQYALRAPTAHSIRGWQDYQADDSMRRQLTMRHLLTMQTGLDWNDFGDAMTLLSISSDPVRFMLDVPFDTLPGSEFNYCSGSATVFGAALAQLVGTDLLTFADSTIFGPAGITIGRWDTDPEGRCLGAAGLYVTPRNLLRFGELYLHKGMAGGKRILGEAWIDSSLAQHAKLDHWDVTPGVNGYGYYWWRRKSHGHQVYYASGYGGQLLYVVPDLDMVIVAVCHLNAHNRGRLEIKKLHKILDRAIRACE